MNVGGIISEYIRKQGIKQSILARRLKVTQPNLAQKLSKHGQNTDHVLQISLELEHDFFKDLSDEFQSELRKKKFFNEMGMSVEEAPSIYQNKKNINERIFEEIKSLNEKINRSEEENTIMRNEIKQLRNNQLKINNLITNNQKEDKI